MSVIKRLMEKQSVEPEVVNLIKALAKTLIFEDTLYVSVAGDNSDGSSWNRAYTNLRTAMDWIEANQITGQTHCIILGAGNWDMNLTGVPTYTANIAIFGTDSRNQAVILNSHATATGVLRFTGWCSINNICIDCGTGEIGIEIEGVGAIGSRIRKVCFYCEALAGGADAILLDGGVSYVKIWDCTIHGEITNTSGIRLNDAHDCIIQEIKIHDTLVGLQSDHANDDDNEFINCHIHGCATGIQLVNAGSTNNHFEHIYFSGCTARISDVATTTLFTNIYVAATIASISPTDLTGQAITAAGAGNWTAVAVQIVAASAKPFYIIGYSYECSAAERYGLRLYIDGGTNPVVDEVIETGAAIAGKTEFSNFTKIWGNQGLAIHGRIKSETGGNDMNVWIKLQII